MRLAPGAGVYKRRLCSIIRVSVEPNGLGWTTVGRQQGCVLLHLVARLSEDEGPTHFLRLAKGSWSRLNAEFAVNACPIHIEFARRVLRDAVVK